MKDLWRVSTIERDAISAFPVNGNIDFAQSMPESVFSTVLCLR